MQEMLTLFRESVSNRPYCTDELGALYIRPRAAALERRYVQPNSPWQVKWLVYDVDRSGGFIDWYDRPNVPPPNLVIGNRENGHAHVLYGLATPIQQRAYGGRDNPLRYAAAIDCALTDALDADPGYAKLIAKNPLRNDTWWVDAPRGVLYDLDWLADYVDLEPYRDRRRNLPAHGLGRNCALFDNLRVWSYRAIRRAWQDNLSWEQWLASALVKAAEYNTFEVPLGAGELKAVARSVAKWTWTRFDSKTFTKIQAERGRRSGHSRRRKAAEIKDRIKRLWLEDPYATNSEIAKWVGVSERTVQRVKRGV